MRSRSMLGMSGLLITLVTAMSAPSAALPSGAASHRPAPPTRSVRRPIHASSPDDKANPALARVNIGVGVSAPCGWMPVPPASYQHVIVIWMENKRWADVFGKNAPAPYEKALAAGCGTATNWQDAGSAYDSEPNYIAFTTGIAKPSVLQRFTCDCPPSVYRHNYVAGNNLFRQVRAAGETERSYEENMATNCQETNGSEYAVKHNPDAFMGTAVNGAFQPDPSCAKNDLASGGKLLYQRHSPFAKDLASDSLPIFSVVTPNLCDDTHDCGVATGDAYLSVLVPLILESTAYRSGSTALIVMWDEDTPVPNIVVAPSVAPATVITTAVSHYGALRAVEEMLGLPLMRAARDAKAQDLRSAFGI